LYLLEKLEGEPGGTPVSAGRTRHYLGGLSVKLTTLDGNEPVKGGVLWRGRVLKGVRRHKAISSECERACIIPIITVQKSGEGSKVTAYQVNRHWKKKGPKFPGERRQAGKEMVERASPALNAVNGTDGISSGRDQKDCRSL